MLRSSSRIAIVIIQLLALSASPLPADEAEHNQRDDFQYLSGTIRIATAREDEPKREKVSYQKAIAYLDDGAIAWQNEYGCITCHTNGSYLLTRPMLNDRFGPPKKQVREFFEAELQKALKDPKHLPPEQSVYLAAGLATDDVFVQKHLSDSTREALRYMFSRQNEQGTWDWPHCWPPLEDSSYHGATVAAMALGTAKRVGADLDEPAIKTGSEHLKKYLSETKPPYDYHRFCYYGPIVAGRAC